MNDDLLLSTDSLPAFGEPAGTNWTPLLLLVIGVILFIGLILLMRWVRKIFGRPEMHGMSREQIQARWEEIEKTAQSGTLGAKMAIMEADKLLDSALKSMMMSGNTLGERLKFAGYKYPELRNVWNAHRLRNRIVHESTFEPGMGEVRSAIRDFKKALQVLKLL